MIQRSGRIDRRLNPRVEDPRDFPELSESPQRVGNAVPKYYWHEHQNEAPVTVNMILPDSSNTSCSSASVSQRRPWQSTSRLGLEQGTGAEADWMASYKYHGIASLNSIQRDRAIEQLASAHQRLSTEFLASGIRVEWAENLNGWFREREADQASPLVGRALLGRRDGGARAVQSVPGADRLGRRVVLVLGRETTRRIDVRRLACAGWPARALPSASSP